MTVTVKRGDTEPLPFVLRYSNGKAILLGGGTPTPAEVRFLAQPVIAGVGEALDLVCTIIEDVVDAKVVDQGRVEIRPLEATFDTAGVHRAEFQVEWPEGTKLTVPKPGYIDFVVEPDLGG